MYFWMINVLCLILFDDIWLCFFYGDPVMTFLLGGLWFRFSSCSDSIKWLSIRPISSFMIPFWSYAFYRSAPSAYSSTLLWLPGGPFFPKLSFFLMLSSSLPTQYYLISLWRVSMSLKTWIPLPLFRWVGFNNHRLKVSKWHSGIEYLVNVLFSKLNALNFVTLPEFVG